MTRILTLLTDFGTRDYYVAAVKGTVLRLAPEARIVDLSHEVPGGDIAAGAFLLSAAAPTFPADTVHLAVVDPGVGGRRRLLAARTPAAVFVGPDNGLLIPALDEGSRIHGVERPDLYLPSPGETFHGRDRFAPIAAFLLRGGEVSELGPEVSDPIRLPAPPPLRGPELLEGRIAHVDRYGNLITDLPSSWLDERFDHVQVGRHRARRRVGCYSEIPAGEAAILPGSLGTLELSLNGDSLARRWSVEAGERVRIRLRRHPPAGESELS